MANDRDQLSIFGDNAEYTAFTEKFVPKKTTDDCYTPEVVYEAVAAWVSETYGVDRASFVRPFWPDGDYERMEYPVGCTVVDNPPFSILTAVCRFYLRRGIPFFLFAPALQGVKIEPWEPMTFLACGADIVYENGAAVKTSFVTSLGAEDTILWTAPELTRAVESASKKAAAMRGRKPVPKYIYPDHVITPALAQRYSHYGIDFRVSRRECVRIPALDAQREKGKSIFGMGLLLSERAAAERAAAERAAAERAAAERAAAERWELSSREWAIVRGLGAEGADTHTHTHNARRAA